MGGSIPLCCARGGSDDWMRCGLSSLLGRDSASDVRPRRASREARFALSVSGPSSCASGPLVGGRRAVLGGWSLAGRAGRLPGEPHGEQASVEVEGFAPLLRGPFWQLEQVVPRSSRQAVPGTGRTRGPLGCVSLSSARPAQSGARWSSSCPGATTWSASQGRLRQRRGEPRGVDCRRCNRCRCNA
jgi:hypothetical protein